MSNRAQPTKNVSNTVTSVVEIDSPCREIQTHKPRDAHNNLVDRRVSHPFSADSLQAWSGAGIPTGDVTTILNIIGQVFTVCLL